MVILWYGIVPLAGAVIQRGKWRKFRRRFDELRLKPVLNYSVYRQIDGRGRDRAAEGGVFRFTGGFESITDGKTLWIQGEDLTVPVFLGDDQTWLLPMQEGEGQPESFDPGEEAPERVRWDRISSLTEGARVFAGGPLVFRDGRWSFVSTKENPLMVIFYDGPDSLLTTRAIRAGRQRNEYWNPATPYSLIAGALCQILIAIAFLNRPAYRLTVVTALVALFIPLFPLIPPGLLFTVLYRRFSWRACILRAYRDLVRLPLRGLNRKTHGDNSLDETVYESVLLPGGERYGCVRCNSLPPAAREGKIPFLLPEYSKGRPKGDWYIFGAIKQPEDLQPGDDEDQYGTKPGPVVAAPPVPDGLPVQPEDPFAVYGIIHGRPELLARRYGLTAYTLEIISWIVLLAGIGLNVFFLRMILLLI
jgi:hypothetical protein